MKVKYLHAIREWKKFADNPSGPLHAALLPAYGDEELLGPPLKLLRAMFADFGKVWGEDRQAFVVRSTGRVNLLGMHVDHRGGSVNPVAIKEAFFIVEPREDDRVVVQDVNGEKYPEESFAIGECLPKGSKIADWDAWCHDELEKRRGNKSITFSNYIRAGVLYFQHLNTTAEGAFKPAFKGMNILVGSHVPAASGLSTSSCLVVASTEAILHRNDIRLDPMDMVQQCGKAEWYVGTRGGFGDHAAIRLGQCDSIVHMTAFPFSLKVIPFPKGYRIVLADSMVEARKQVGAKDGYNTPIASYAFGLWLARKARPKLAEKMEHLRDIRPEKLGVSEAEILRIIRALPERATRAEVLAMLPEQKKSIQNIFRSHNEPKDGYRIRGTCMYGISECMRSFLAPDLLQKGDIAGFGRLMSLHHDGDRVARLKNGKMEPEIKDYSDARMDQLIADAESNDPQRQERAHVWAQPGAYNVSVAEMDMLADLALQIEGVAGAGLVGAGLGGSLAILAKAEKAEAVVKHLADNFYKPKGLPVKAEIVSAVGGAGVLKV